MPSEIELISLRTSKVNYCLVGGILGGVCIFSATVAFSIESSFLVPAGICGIIFLASMAWMRAARLDLTATSITYGSLLRSRSISLHDAMDIRWAFGLAPGRPFQRIEISTIHGNEIYMNAGLFDAKQTKHLVEVAKGRLEKPLGVPGAFQVRGE